MSSVYPYLFISISLALIHIFITQQLLSKRDRHIITVFSDCNKCLFPFLIVLNMCSCWCSKWSCSDAETVQTSFENKVLSYRIVPHQIVANLIESFQIVSNRKVWYSIVDMYPMDRYKSYYIILSYCMEIQDAECMTKPAQNPLIKVIESFIEFN